MAQGKAERSGKCQVLGMQDWAGNKTAEKKFVFLDQFKRKYVNREMEFGQFKDILHPL